MRAIRLPVRLGALALASLLLASCGSGEEAPAENAGETPAAGNDAPLLENAAGDAVAAIEAWAEPLRAAGYTIAYDAAGEGATSVTNVIVSGPEHIGISLSVASAGRVAIDGDALTFVPDGDLTLTMAPGPDAIERAFQSSSVAITHAESGDAGEALSFVFSDAAIAGGIAETMSITAQSGEGGAAYGVAIDSFAIVGDSPFGATVGAIGAILVPSDAGIAVTDLAVDWGVLQMTGAGEVTMDDTGAVTGRFDAMIADPLVMLDGVRAWTELDRDAMAGMYAAILFEMSLDPEALALPFAVAVDGADMTILGEGRDVGDLALGPVLPFLAGAGQ